MQSPKVDTAELNSGALGRIAALDGLRGYAVLMVMFHHFYLGDSTEYPFAFVRWIVRVFKSGWIGVDLFFVLSGFLITSGLLESKGKPGYFLNFYAKRTLRIFPLYYGVLLFVLVFLPLVTPSGSELVGSPSNHQSWLWLYLTNIAIVISGQWEQFNGPVFHFGHFWTLAVEEHFYLIWPLLIAFLPRRRLFLGCIATIIAAPVARCCYLVSDPGNLNAPHIHTFCRMDTLAIGALAAVLLRDFGLERLRRPAVWIATITGVAIAVLLAMEKVLRATGSHVSIFIYSLLGIFFASLLLVLMANGREGVTRLLFCNRFATTMGKYSYGLYVYHGLISGVFATSITVAAVNAFVPTSFLASLVRGALWLFAAFLCAFLSWHLYERHWLKLKRHFT